MATKTSTKASGSNDKISKASQMPLDKVNFIILAIAFILIVVGFALMIGPKSTYDAFDSSIFNFRYIVLAPGICLFGYILIVFAIMYKRKNKSASDSNSNN